MSNFNKCGYCSTLPTFFLASWLAQAGEICLRHLYLSMFPNKGATSLYFPLTVHKCVSEISHLKPPWLIHKLWSQWVLHRISCTTSHTEAIVILHEGSTTSTALTSQKHCTRFFGVFFFLPSQVCLAISWIIKCLNQSNGGTNPRTMNVISHQMKRIA